MALLLSPPWPPLPARSPAKVLIEVFEIRRASREARVVVVVPHRDPRDEPVEAESILPSELGVLEIDLMNDLRDCGQRPIGDPEAREKDFEGAGIAQVGELRLEHVEADLAGPGRVVLTR